MYPTSVMPYPFITLILWCFLPFLKKFLLEIMNIGVWTSVDADDVGIDDCRLVVK